MTTAISIITDATHAFALNRAAGVQPALGFDVCGVRVCSGRVDSKVPLFPIYSDSCRPSTVSVFSHASKPIFTVFASALQILSIYRPGGIAQVHKAVVVPDAVDVVDVMRRHDAVRVEPRKSMGLVQRRVNFDANVSGFCSGPSDGANRGAPAAALAATVHKPSEYASCRVVMKKLAQTLRGKIGFSHEALQLLIGQRPARVDALGGLRHFSGAA